MKELYITYDYRNKKLNNDLKKYFLNKIYYFDVLKISNSAIISVIVDDEEIEQLKQAKQHFRGNIYIEYLTPFID